MLKVLITGTSRGIGEALKETFLQANWEVYGLSRNGLPAQKNYHHTVVDLQKFRQEDLLFVESQVNFDLVILNAAVLGEINFIEDSSLDELRSTMDINLWAQKRLIDLLLKHNSPRKIYAISSGAALKGKKGWGAYSLSKSAFKTLIELYASERTDTHFLNIAPGLVNTSMQDILCDQIDHTKFTNMRRLKEARANGDMVTAQFFAQELFERLEALEMLGSGEFKDFRDYRN